MKLYKIISLSCFPIVTSSFQSIIKDFISLITETLEKSNLNPGWSNKPVVNNLIPASLKEIQIQAHNAFASYCEPDELKTWQCKVCKGSPGIKLQEFYENKAFDSQSYLGINDKKKEIILSFRGTTSLVDQMINHFILLVKSEFVPVKGALVHAGFLYAMDSLIEPMIEDLKELLDKDEYKDYKITFVGHSLGGALATLGLLKVQKELNLPYSKLQLFTYGQPRAGNYKFASWFDTLPIVVARVVNKKDPVPATPAYELFNFSHIGNEVYIMENNTIKYCNPNVLEDKECLFSFQRRTLYLWDHFSYFDLHSGRSSC